MKIDHKMPTSKKNEMIRLAAFQAIEIVAEILSSDYFMRLNFNCMENILNFSIPEQSF